MDRHGEREGCAGRGCDGGGRRHDVLCQGSFDAVPGEDDAVSPVAAPCLEELAGGSGLEHPWGCEDDGGADVVKLVDGAEGGDVLEEERV